MVAKSGVSAAFLDFVLHNSLSQIVTFPTRGSNLLDIILCSEPDMVTTVKQSDSPSYSDHVGLECKLAIMKESPVLSNKIQFNFRKADWEGLEDFYSSFDWNKELLTRNFSCSQMYAAFISILQVGIVYNVPEHRTSKKSKKFNTKI